MVISKYILIPSITVSVLVLAGCTQTTMNTNTVSNTNNDNTNTNSEVVVNTNIIGEDGEVDTNDWLTYTNEEYGFSLSYPKNFTLEESYTNHADKTNNYLLLDVGFKPDGVIGEPLRIVVINHSLSQWDDIDASEFGTQTGEQKQMNGLTWQVLESSTNRFLAIEHDSNTYLVSISNDVAGETKWADAYNLIVSSFSF